MIKAMALGSLVSGTLALVIGSQGSSGGLLAIHPVMLADVKLYWSWPVFIATSGLFQGIIWLQR